MAKIITTPDLLEGLGERQSRQPARRVLELEGIETIELIRTRKNTVACRVISSLKGVAENFDGEPFDFVGSVVIFDLQQTQQLLSLKVTDEDTITIIDGVPSVVAGVTKDTPKSKTKPVKK